MKGHMEDGKFHPHTEHKKGVRKSRDQKAKQEGVRFKKELKVPRNTEVIKVKGTKKEIIKKLMDTKQWNGFENISDDGWFSGSIYLDNGEGRSGYAEFRGKISDGKVEVKMNKNDVPSFWRDLYYDDLFMEATDKVRDTFEEMMTERKKREEDKTLNEMFEERGLNRPFFEENAIKQAQKNPKNIGRRDHDLLLKIEHAQLQLKMAKGQPLRQQYFKDKIKKLESQLI